MNVEVIAIGDELLLGQTVNTNAAWLGLELSQVGGSVVRSTVLADSPEGIVSALANVLPETELVVLTGGLGPTKDDLTKKVLTDYFGGELVYQPSVFAHIEQLFQTLGRVPSELNREQAYLPNNATVLQNAVGTAMGMAWDFDGKRYVSLPGVPYEMKHLAAAYILPWVQQRSRFWVQNRTVRTQGVPESELADRISAWEDALPSFVKLAYLPAPGLVKLRLSVRVPKEAAEAAKQEVETQVQALVHLLGAAYFGEGDRALEEVVGDALAGAGQTVATAESCTGGAVGAALTSIPGSSRYFVGGIQAYANRIKTQLLGVDEAALVVHGAVSEVVAKALASGARKRLGSDWAVATTGVAGPDGGSPEKPVGTVWIAVAGPDGCRAERFQMGKDRSRNIQKSVQAALNMLRQRVVGASQRGAVSEN